jgi:hypothetical protein
VIILNQYNCAEVCFIKKVFFSINTINFKKKNSVKKLTEKTGIEYESNQGDMLAELNPNEKNLKILK